MRESREGETAHPENLTSLDAKPAFIREGGFVPTIDRQKEIHMAYALKSESRGTFIGIGMGMIFFSKEETAGQHIACTMETPEDAKSMIEELGPSFPDLEPVEVKSGYWRDLKAAGLHIGDMIRNELLARPVAGRA